MEISRIFQLLILFGVISSHVRVHTAALGELLRAKAALHPANFHVDGLDVAPEGRV